MEKIEIHTKLNKIFQTVFKDSNLQIRDDMSAKDVAKWDSLNHMTLIATVEKEFGFKFKLKELVNMKNVGDLLTAISLKACQ